MDVVAFMPSCLQIFDSHAYMRLEFLRAVSDVVGSEKMLSESDRLAYVKTAEIRCVSTCKLYWHKIKNDCNIILNFMPV